MNIKILDSWLREYLKTDAKPEKIAEILSLTSVAIERMEKHGSDISYDIEITTNRPELMSVMGIAQEATAALTQAGIDAAYIQHKHIKLSSPTSPIPLKIKTQTDLTKRVCAVVLEVQLGKSPEQVAKRLESSDIRSLNNVIDVTNYVMREIGHPTHVMDYDRLVSPELTIRESKAGETIKTLDGKEYKLPGGDIVAVDKKDQIVDLLGVMGLANSVVTEQTKRILYFINTDDPHKVRKTSMALGIRTEAAVLNEKSLSPSLAELALARGVELFKEIAHGKVVSEFIDIYPQKPKEKRVSFTIEKVNAVIGVEIPAKTIKAILEKLGFEIVERKDKLEAIVPTERLDDVYIEEDIIEEVARIYGYQNIPSILPPTQAIQSYHLANNDFYWEDRIKDALKYWGFTEVYTYSMVSEELFEGPLSDGVVLQNPLSEDMVVMRKSLIPSLQQILLANKQKDTLQIFEISNTYQKRAKNLPREVQTLAGIIKKPNISFFEVKGILEQLFTDLGVEDVEFKLQEIGGTGADIFVGIYQVGTIENLDSNVIDFEINVEQLLKYVSLKKVYKPVPVFPPVIEDVSMIVEDASYATIVETIKKQSKLIRSVELLDTYQNKKTFRIYYQHKDRNLTNEDVAKEREKVYSALEKDLQAKIV